MTPMQAPISREVVIPAGPTYAATPALAMLPSGATRGVVVVHEIYGRQPEIDRVVARFAAAGYAAVAPELFAAPSKLTCLRQTFRAMRLGRGPAVEQARGIRAWLCEEAQLQERSVGIIGFCFGGGYALAVGRGWGAVSTNYGPIPSVPEVLTGMGPTIGCYGGRDVIFGKNGPILEQRLAAVGVEVEAHTFADVGHSFLTDGHHPVMSTLSWPVLRTRNAPAEAEEGWRRIFAFFDRHLG
jgi:carboxymethylenebutenolidase